MARRGWDALSAGYRARLERSGVTRADYEAGASLQKARGHVSATHERAQSRQYRAIDRWVAHYSSMYRQDPDDVRDAIKEHGLVEAERAIRFQSELERDYSRGLTKRASQKYAAGPPPDYPDWLFYYHGVFS